jgi:hypothetical protein
LIHTLLFSEANKTLSSYLKQLVKNGKIAATVHKFSLTADIIKKLFEKREPADVDTQSPRALLQTAWFQISIYFGRRGRPGRIYCRGRQTGHATNVKIANLLIKILNIGQIVQFFLIM